MSQAVIPRSSATPNQSAESSGASLLGEAGRIPVSSCAPCALNHAALRNSPRVFGQMLYHLPQLVMKSFA
jgi:hypothetical protein